MRERIANENGGSHAPVRGQNVSSLDWRWIAIVAVVAIYAATVTPGHVFGQDDFAAYLMHAANLVEGRPYTAINYVPNPDALWIAPSHGYPPMYPLILAPIYKVRGFDLRAMKIATVLCFGVFLAAFSFLFAGGFPPWACFAAILVVGFNIVFWEQRDYLLSEFPYLMFSFCALLTAQKTYEDLDPRTWRAGAALLLSLLLYGAYGTRTIGITLLPALVLADLCKFRRPSRFLIVVVLLTATLILLQNMVFVSPKAYLDAVHLSVAVIWQHAMFYCKALSYVWRNGASKTAQIAFALLFTALAGTGFLRRLWTRRSITEFYLVGYLAVLIAWSAEIGLRGLLPVLPLYLAYGLEEFVNVSARFAHASRAALAMLLFAYIGVTYLGAFRWSTHQEHLLNVGDPEAQELFAFLRETTGPADVLIFPKPRILALFTHRATATLGPNETPAQSARFFATINARVLIQNESMTYPIQDLIASKQVVLTPVFHNATFQVFLIGPQR